MSPGSFWRKFFFTAGSETFISRRKSGSFEDGFQAEMVVDGGQLKLTSNRSGRCAAWSNMICRPLM